MQFLYLQNCVPLQSVAQISIFFSLVLFSLEMDNKSRKKLTGKKLNVDRQFFKDVLCVISLQEGVGSGNSWEKLTLISSISIYSHLLSSQMKIFMYSSYPFLLQPPSLPPPVLLINNIYSWKEFFLNFSSKVLSL